MERHALKKGSMVLIALILFLGALTDTYAADISLSPGWNLVSLPVQLPANTPATSALSSINGAYEVVWAYSNGIWNVYDPNDPAGSTLTTMQAGNGYWIKMTMAKTLSASGVAPPSSLPLNSGWNLVGYNGTECAQVSDSSAGLSTLGSLQTVWGYPSQGWQFYDPANSGGLTQLCPGSGYWIDVSGTETWTLPSSTPTTLSPGTMFTMATNSAMLVPAGTTIFSPNDTKVTVNGENNTINTLVGSIVSVPSSATGPATNLVSTGSTSGGTATGTANVSVIAGSATTNLNPTDGTETAAIFWGAGRLALDRSGDIIVVDRGVLRLVTQAGVVTTYHNSGLLWAIDGVAVDSAGNIFASGVNGTAPPLAWNGFIQELTTSGIADTLAASWESTSNNTSTGCGGLAVDSSGTLYLADEINNRIVTFTSTGVMSVFAGSGTSGFRDGVGASAMFNDPSNLAFGPDGNLFVVDSGNKAIRKITPDGAVSTIAALPDNGNTIAVDPSGNIYVAEWPYALIRISPDGSATSFSIGNSNSICGLAADSSGNVYAGTRGIGAQILKISF
jgi:hypothetical protein